MQDVLIYGAGGHCKVVINLLSCLGGYHVVGILDDRPQIAGTTCLGYEVLGAITSINQGDYPNCGIVIGAAKPAYRRTIWTTLTSLGYEAITLVHPSACVSHHVTIGAGTMILANTIVNVGAKIGTGVLINNGSIVEHDCTVGDFSHIAPGANLAGAVEIGDCTLVGIGATIIEFQKVGKNATIGAGAVVIHDVAPCTTVVGNPARVVKSV